MIAGLTPQEYAEVKHWSLVAFFGWLIGTVLLKWLYDWPETLEDLVWNFVTALSGLVAGLLLGIGAARWYRRRW